MPQISLKVNENGTLTIKDQNTSNPLLAEDGLLKLYAPLASPALTGNPTAPTPTDINDASTKIATTSFVGSKIAQVNNTINSVSGASVTLTGAQEITGSKTFTNNYTKIQDVSGNVKLEVKNSGVEIRGQIEMYGSIKPVNLSAGVVRKDTSSEALTTGSIIEADIAANAVTTNKINDGAVTDAKIAANAVTTNKINDGAVTDAKIASNAVTDAKIASNAVTTAKIDSNAVTTDKINDGAVTFGKIDSSVYSVTNTPNTLVQRDSSGNISGLSGSDPDAVKLTGDQTISGTKTFDSLPICSTDASGNYYLTNLRTVNTVVAASLDALTIGTAKIDDSAVTLAKIDSSVYSVSNTPNTLVQRDTSGNMPANNNWTGNNAFSPSNFFIGGTVDAPMYKPFGLSFLNTDSDMLQLAATNLSRYYICGKILGTTWDIYLPKMTSDMLGIVITFRNFTYAIPTINAWSGDSPDQILDNSRNIVTPTLDTSTLTVTIIAGYIEGQIGMWFII